LIDMHTVQCTIANSLPRSGHGRRRGNRGTDPQFGLIRSSTGGIARSVRVSGACPGATAALTLSGTPIGVVDEISGHASFATTRRLCGGISAEARVQAADAMAAAFADRRFGECLSRVA
jgi:hypothetical protein